MSNIKKAVALVLCDTIRQENSGKWYTVAGLTCWYCIRSSKLGSVRCNIFPSFFHESGAQLGPKFRGFRENRGELASKKGGMVGRTGLEPVTP